MRIVALSFVTGLAAIVLAGCALLDSRDSVSPPTSGDAATGPSQQERRGIIQACPDPPAGEARCFALILEGQPTRDGATGPRGGFSPADLQKVYNLPSSSKGSGQIVAIVDAYDNPNVATDLAYYRSYFGLPKANFFKYNQEGQKSNYPKNCLEKGAGWCDEIDIDVDMVSAACPNCTIYLVEANSGFHTNFEVAEAQAVRLGAHIVSDSWGCNLPNPNCGFHQNFFDTPGVTYVVAAGDDGYGTAEPVFDSVVSVGGTHLERGRGRRGWNESAWGGNGYPEGPGGGCSNQPKPAWQHDAGCSFRTANDAAAVADPLTPVDVYDSLYPSSGGWVLDGGTSVAAPLIAGVFGLAGNATKQNGGKTFWEKAHQQPSDLNPISRGSDGHCTPRYLCTDGTREYKSYGGPTGWGTPNGVGAF